MSNVTLNSITSGYNLSKINDNFAKLTSALNSDRLQLSGGGNVLLQDIDMNSFNLLNIGTLNSGSISLNGVPLVVGSMISSVAPNIISTTNLINGAVTDIKISGPITPSKVTFQQLGTGAIVSDIQTKARERVSVKDFGAVGDGITDDTAAFKAARDYLQTNSDYRGGIIFIPRGNYKLSDEWTFTQYSTGLVHNIFISGDGVLNTTLDFSAAPVGKNGISFGPGTHFGISDLCITGAKKNGIDITGSTTINGSTYSTQFYVRNVRVQFSGGHGINSTNSYLGTFADIWSKGNSGNGFNMAGFHTSLVFTRCESSENSGEGWRLNGLIYSSLNGCGSDGNTFAGYHISNTLSTAFISCGSESNQRDGWLFEASNAVTDPGLTTAMQDVHGVVINSCYGISNSLLSAGTYSNFISASTTDNRKVDLVVNGGASWPSTNSDKAIVANNVSGKISIHEDSLYTAGHTTREVLTGSIDYMNNGLKGKVSTANLSTTFSIPNGVMSNIPWDTLSINDLGCTLTSGNITIPQGVHKIKVVCGIQISANTTGVRQLQITKNSAGVTTGMPFSGINAASAGATGLYLASSIISVIPGDTIQCATYQNSGGSLTISTSTNNFLSVECIG